MPFFKRKSDKQKQPASLLRFSPIKKSPSNKNVRAEDLQNDAVGSVLDNNRSHKLFDLQDVSQSAAGVVPLFTSSRLSKTIYEVLYDRDALAYFLNFLESKCAAHMLRFWLDARSFHAAALTRVCTQTVRRRQRRETHPDVCDSKHASLTETVGDRVVDADVCLRVDTEHDIDTGSGASSPTSPVTRHFRDSRAFDNAADSLRYSDISFNNDGATSNNAYTAGAIPLHTSMQDSDRVGCVASGHVTSSEDDLADKLQKSIARDAVTIYSKYISLDAPLVMHLPERVRNDAISKICKEDGSVDVTCFVKCQEHVVEMLRTSYFESFKQSLYHYKHQIDLLTSGKLYLADFIYHDSAMFYFMEYIEREGAAQLLQFVISADNFQQHLQKGASQYHGEEAQVDAMVLYDKYFSLQASNPLGFSDKSRYDIESNICREEGPLPDCFSAARNIALGYIERSYFDDFLKSEIYYKFLTELISSVQMLEVPAVALNKHRRTGSETSSEVSIGSHSTGNDSLSARNTLLASSDKRRRKGGVQKLDDVNMDDTYFNPDQLWKRSNAGSLKLGQVDNMGRFTSYFQPEPGDGRKKGSGFFKKNSDKLKEEEQMALRIAQMIISDVTNVTQSDMARKSDTL